MPTVSISRYEIAHKILPPVCIITGVPTAHTQTVRYVWYPSRVWWGFLLCGFAGLGIAILVFKREITLQIPVVRSKRYYWLWHRFRKLAAIMVCLNLVVYCYANSNGISEIKSDLDYGLWICHFGLACSAFVGIWLLHLNRSTLYAAEVTASGITLDNVHENFAFMLEIERMLESHRETERYEAYVIWQREKDDAELAGWGSGHSRARRAPASESSNSPDDEQALLKSAEDELRADPPKPDKSHADAVNPGAPG